MIKGILLCAWVGISSLLHPFHVSISDVVYSESEKTLQISSRIFQDDLEQAMNKVHNVDNYFETRGNDLIKKDLSSFLKDNLRFAVNGTAEDYQFLGYELEEGVVWCYMEINKVRKLKNMEVQYTILFDSFDDQYNLLHLKYRGEIKSLRFSKNQPIGRLELED